MYDFNAWKMEVMKTAKGLIGLGDVMDEDDPYDLGEAMSAAFADGQNPEAFVREIFADDLASAEHDELMQTEAEASGEFEDPDSSHVP